MLIVIADHSISASSNMESDIGSVLQILKELQKSSKLQQEQIDLLILAAELKQDTSLPLQGVNDKKRKVAELLTSSIGVKVGNPDPTSVVQVDSLTSNGKDADRKEFLDKLFEKESFLKLWEQLSVKLEIGSLESLEKKEEIRKVLERACEKAKVVCTMNYDALLTNTLRRVVRHGQVPAVDSLKYSAGNSTSGSNKKVCYAHNIEKFDKTMYDFFQAQQDPHEHFVLHPRKTLLSESCFSATSQIEFRNKRQLLPFAVCCIKKPGFLTFFTGDWAFEEKHLPNSSNFSHYTTLDMEQFISKEDLESARWQDMEQLLSCAACPADCGIGSATMFTHGHRGNIVCAKVILNRDTQQHVLKLYPHATCKVPLPQGIIVNFDDDGDRYLKLISEKCVVNIVTS